MSESRIGERPADVAFPAFFVAAFLLGAVSAWCLCSVASSVAEERARDEARSVAYFSPSPGRHCECWPDGAGP